MVESDDPTRSRAATVPGDVDDGIRRLIADLEQRGWTLQIQFVDRGSRYWCPCGGHETWIELYPKAEGYEAATRQRLAHRCSCWEVNQ